ncbi:histone-like nucleoid-structuring protein Lsr2 [Gordonia aurantiaca]|uniref:histone-like nucleoid-structuring protein Lsr2 n=1 Tax=Gordonia sp. B21 TaxID=3151852 RepID=UPI003262E7A8
MAKKEIVQVIDDLDGKVLDQYETVRWSLDGKNYEFDTSAKHAQQFRDSLQKYLEVSRQVGRTTKRSAATATTSSGGGRNKETTKAIREWAIREGYELSDRGRIPQSIIEAFEAAH